MRVVAPDLRDSPAKRVSPPCSSNIKLFSMLLDVLTYCTLAWRERVLSGNRRVHGRQIERANGCSYLQNVLHTTRPHQKHNNLIINPEIYAISVEANCGASIAWIEWHANLRVSMRQDVMVRTRRSEHHSMQDTYLALSIAHR
jgi:hypothetical protein